MDSSVFLLFSPNNITLTHGSCCKTTDSFIPQENFSSVINVDYGKC